MPIKWVEKTNDKTICLVFTKKYTETGECVCVCVCVCVCAMDMWQLLMRMGNLMLNQFYKNGIILRNMYILDTS